MFVYLQCREVARLNGRLGKIALFMPVFWGFRPFFVIFWTFSVHNEVNSKEMELSHTWELHGTIW